jgi:hypothetical protein
MNRIRQGSRERFQGVSGEGSERTVLQNGCLIAYDIMTAVGIGAACCVLARSGKVHSSACLVMLGGWVSGTK